MRVSNSYDFIRQNLQKQPAPSMRYSGKEELVEWQKRANVKLWELLGLHRIQKCEDDFLIEREEQKEG